MISIWYLYDICMISIIWSLSLYISDLNVSISADPYHVGRVSKDFQGTEAKPWLLRLPGAVAAMDMIWRSPRWWLLGHKTRVRSISGLYTSDLRVVQSYCSAFYMQHISKKTFSWTTRNTHQLTLPSLRSSACCRTYASAATACSYLQLRLPPSHPMPRLCGMAAWIWIWFTIRSPKLLRNEENKDVYPTRIIKNQLNYTSF